MIALMSGAGDHPCDPGGVFRDRCASAAWRIGCGNLAAKAPSDLRSEFKTRVSACYQVPSWAIARCLATESRRLRRPPAERRSPVEDDFQVCIAHLRLPVTCRCCHSND